MGLGLGLELGLENKERSKDNQKHYLAIDDKLGHHFMWYIDCSCIGSVVSGCRCIPWSEGP